MTKLLIKNAHIISPADKLDTVADLLIEAGRITTIAAEVAAPASTQVIEAAGKTLLPGLIDMHVHLRDPGLDYKEDIDSGLMAAAAGGFTQVACMPNTDPVVDNRTVVDYITNKAKDNPVTLHVIGAISSGLAGQTMADYDRMLAAGIIAVSDDGKPVQDPVLLQRVFEYLRPCGIPIICHCEEQRLRGQGTMHEGPVSVELGMPGISSLVEELAVARDIQLAEYTNGRIHIAHISTRGSVELVRAAKKRGVRVTTEVCPHHIACDYSLLKSFDTNYKMNPPLRTKDDIAALIDGLIDGTIDVIATDHAPHTAVEKDVEFNLAPFGVVGLETAFAICYTELVLPGRITLSRLVDLMSRNPAAIIGGGGGNIRTGELAELALVDTTHQYTVNPTAFYSKSRNTPFAGRKVTGRIELTISKGQIAFQNKLDISPEKCSNVDCV